jgi:hypothetical protein
LTTLDLNGTRLQPADVYQLLRLPRLRELVLLAPQFVIEDLEPLAQHPTLQTIHVAIAASLDERRKFEDAHPELRIGWLGTPYGPFGIMLALLERWKVGDGGEISRGSSYSLNLTSVYLNPKRLARIPRDAFMDLTNVRLGECDSTATAFALIDACPNLESLNTGDIAFDADDLARLAKNQTIKRLTIRRTKANVEQLTELVKMQKLKQLDFDEETFPADVRRQVETAIHKKSPRILVNGRLKSDEGEGIFGEK